jgi:hypothetical protein
MSDPNQSQEMLRTKLNGETSKAQFTELLRFFAAGNLIFVSDDLDLVDVAVRVALDDKAAVTQWMNAARIARVSDAQADAWIAANAALWTVVVKPWVLVQEHALREAPAASGSVH